MRSAPLIVGLNNPKSDDPNMALYPHDKFVAGYRLWKMVYDVSDIELDEWMRRVRRVNLFNARTLPSDWRDQAVVNASRINIDRGDAPVVLLGSIVPWAMGHVAEPFVWSGGRVAIPHPSGRCRFYNDPVCRLAAGILLSDVLRECQ